MSLNIKGTAPDSTNIRSNHTRFNSPNPAILLVKDKSNTRMKRKYKKIPTIPLSESRVDTKISDSNWSDLAGYCFGLTFWRFGVSRYIADLTFWPVKK